MDLLAAIGILSSMVTFEEAGRSWLQIIKDKIKKKELDIRKWYSNEPLVQRCLDKFKTQMAGKYDNYIFSDKEINDIIQGFFDQNKELLIDDEEKNKLILIIKDIFVAYNEYTKSLMSSGEKTLHNTLLTTHTKTINKLDSIKDHLQQENIKKFLRAIENSKEIELNNIDELINGEYEIDRTEFIGTIKSDGERFISIQGNAGSGKSVICKKLLSEKKHLLVTRAEKLSTVKRINELWDCDLEDAIQWLNNELLYIFIDAIEFIADCGNNSFLLLQEIYRIAEKYSNVRVITSCRSTDSSAFMKINAKYKIKTYEVPNLSTSEVDRIAKKYSIISSLQQDKKYANLLVLPFYINLIISGGFGEDNINDENDFRNLIWEKIVCIKDKCKLYGILQSDVRKAVERIVFERAKNFTAGVDIDIVNSDILESLLSEGIIVRTGNKLRLKYDIFEDICFERYLDKAFDSCRCEYNNFFSKIEKMGRCIYRRYQIWISNKLFVQSDREKFIYTLLIDDRIKPNWKKQTEIGIVKSKYCKLFFDEFSNVLNENLLVNLINITNLYAFEAKINHSPLIMLVTPVGAARECLINVIYDKRINPEKHSSSIIKLCADYANSLNKSDAGKDKACRIIINFIEGLILRGKLSKSFYEYDKEIVQLFLILVKMTESSKQWVENFVENMIDEYNSSDSRKESVSEKILEAIVKQCTLSFAMELPELACKSAETLWRKRESRNLFPYVESDLDNTRAYGLSNNANYFGNSENGVYNNSFIWLVVRCHFDIYLDWAISFINDAIQTFSATTPNDVEQIQILFPEENKKRKYWGNESLWMADVMEHNLPVVLTDIIFAIKKTLIYAISNSKDNSYIKTLTDYVRKNIYEKSNNILLLSIIESIGMNFQKELPGYAVELASSMKLIYYDIRRSGEFIHNPTTELLEKQIMLSIGVPKIEGRYEKDEKCACNLQQYFSTSSFYGDKSIKDKCHAIMDYLYSKYDEVSCPTENLQIQKMDFRDVSVTKVDEKTFMIEPQIKGEAKKIIEETEATNKPIELLTESINNLIHSISEKKATANNIVYGIDMLCDKMSNDILIDIKFEAILIQLIAVALITPDITDEQRNKLVEKWISRVEKVFLNQSYVTEVNLEIALWEQLNKNIDDNLKNRILLIMLESIVNEKHSGLICKLSELIKIFLTRNKNFARRIFNTIIKLAKDEMNHQKFNALFITREHKGENFNFVPNMTPKLRGVDHLILGNDAKAFDSMEDQIIQDYLYNGKELNFSEFDISKYDINTLCNVASCGLDIQDERFVRVITSIVDCMIEIWHSSRKEMRAHEIVDVYQEQKIVSYFQRELDILDKDPTEVYDILFKNKDYSMFTRDTVNFYEDIFSVFFSAYVDGFTEKGKRADIEKKINLLESYVNVISSGFVKNELEKRLFLGRGRYTSWDINKVHTEYGFKDKCFLNTQIKKYGVNHLQEVLSTVYLLNIEKLLPEILISISLCFKKGIADKEKFVKDITSSQAIVDMLILKAFINHSDAIKHDVKMIEAYEEILISLTEIKNEKAAVLLDEFRIH